MAKIDQNSIRHGMTGWERWYSGNCSRGLNIPNYQKVHVQLRINLREWNAYNPVGFWDTDISPNPRLKTRHTAIENNVKQIGKR